MREAGIPCVPGYANFVLMDCGQRAVRIAEGLEKEKILVGAGFPQDCLKKYLRVTVAGVENMQRFWRVFERLFTELT